MHVKRYLQFSLRSALAFLTLVALVLALLPHIQAAREAARRRQTVNTFRQHSSFHSVGCDLCRETIVGVVRGSPGYTNNVSTRLIFIGYAADDPDPAPEILDALNSATRDSSRQIRNYAFAALARINSVDPSQ